MSSPIILTDVASNTYLDAFDISAADGPTLEGSDDWFIRKYRLRGGLSDNVDVVVLDNGQLSLSVLPTRGMGLWRGRYRDTELGWDSPVAMPVHPQFVNLEDRGGIGWLAGFNELLVRCGLASNGAPCTDEVTGWQNPLHGRIANRPAGMVACQVIEEGPGRLRLLGVTEEAMLFGGRYELTTMYETEVGSNAVTVIDKVTNLGGKPADWELLYHLNVGPPLLEEGARLVAPVKELSPRDARAAEGITEWKRYRAPDPAYTEEAFFMFLESDADGQTAVLLRNAAGDRGLSLHYRTEDLPCFTLWKNTQAEADGYVTGLEPGINFPNPKPFEKQMERVGLLEPGESREVRFTLAVHDTSEAVAAVERTIGDIEDGSAPIIHETPDLPFAPELD